MVSTIRRILDGADHDYSDAGPDSPTIQWLGIQNMLEQAESEVLILLDCCAGVSSTSEAGSGVTEVIAACGFETYAPGVSEHSFTGSLIDELQYWCNDRHRSVAMLHTRVLGSMKHWKPRSGLATTNRGKRQFIPFLQIRDLQEVSNLSLFDDSHSSLRNCLSLWPKNQPRSSLVHLPDPQGLTIVTISTVVNLPPTNTFGPIPSSEPLKCSSPLLSMKISGFPQLLGLSG